MSSAGFLLHLRARVREWASLLPVPRDDDFSPLDYQPPAKDPPPVTEDAPGLADAQAARASLEATQAAPESLTEIAANPRKPRQKKATERVAETARQVVSRVREAVGEKPGEKRPTESELAKLVAAEDARRMRAVKRYRSEARGVLSPVVRGVLRQMGLAKVPQETIDAVIDSVERTRSFAGYMSTKGGQVKVRRLGPGAKLAYTFGSTAMDVELWGARQWLKHPTVFDVIANVATAAELWDQATVEGSPLHKAIQEAASRILEAAPATESQETH